jgi:hypothetical protein
MSRRVSPFSVLHHDDTNEMKSDKTAAVERNYRQECKSSVSVKRRCCRMALTGDWEF